MYSLPLSAAFWRWTKFLKFALMEREKEKFSSLMQKNKFKVDHLSIWVGEKILDYIIVYL